jgi:hypothetical protein
VLGGLRADHERFALDGAAGCLRRDGAAPRVASTGPQPAMHPTEFAPALFWPAASFLGAGKNAAAELADLKGEADAVEQYLNQEELLD